MPMFLLCITQDKQYELVGYWLRLADRFDMVREYQSSIAMCEKKAGLTGIDLATCVNAVASFLNLNARFAGAEPMFRRALQICQQMQEPDHSDAAIILNNLASLVQAKGDFDEAELLYRHALEARQKLLGPMHPDTVVSLTNLAGLLITKGDSVGAAEMYNRVIAAYHRRVGSDELGAINPLTWYAALSHNQLAVHRYIPTRDWEQAETHLREAVELTSKIGRPVEAANMELNLQKLFHLSGRKVDIKKAKELTKILQDAGDKRAQKGRELLEELK